MKIKPRKQGIKLVSRMGDGIENRIGMTVKNRLEVDDLKGEPEELQWYRVPLPEGRSGDGSSYHTYISRGTANQLCIIISGGGVA